MPSPEIQAVCGEGAGKVWGGVGWATQDLASRFWLPSCGEKTPAAAKMVPTVTQRWLLLGLAASQPAHSDPNQRLPALGRLPRDSSAGDLIHLCEPKACGGSSWISPGGVVNKMPGPHPYPRKDTPSPQQSPNQCLCSPLSSPCEHLCVSLSLFPSDTLCLPNTFFLSDL